MSTIVHERPGIYSSYDASRITSGAAASRTVGLAAQATKGTVGQAVTLTSHTACVATFGESSAMAALSALLFANGATSVVAVRTADTGTTTDYQTAFSALEQIPDIQVVVCDSEEQTVHQALRTSIQTASANRRERIAVVGGSEETVQEAIAHAAALNSERMILVAPDISDELSAVYGAAALAGAIATVRDPAAPVNGMPLYGLNGVNASYSDNDIDLLVRGGVTPLELTAGTVSPVRGVTTRTKTDDTADATWREITTILIVDDVIPSVRDALRNKFVRAKNTPQSRSAIRSQVVVELEKKKTAQIIESYGDVSVTAMEDDPSVCLVEFSFAVAHGLNQIYLTAHITV